MGRERQDGSIQSANTPSYNGSHKAKVDRDFGMYRCMITKVNFVDDDENLTFENKQVTYEAVILGGPKEGQILQNVKSSGDYGGEFNFAEKIWRPIDTKNINDKPLSEHVGDVVYIDFLQGNMRAPVIIGGGIQFNDIDSTGATRDDGFRMRRQYNGVFEQIDKNGNYILQRKGGELDEESGIFTPTDGGDAATLEIKDQQFSRTVGTDQVEEVVDGKTQTMTITFKGGMVVTLDGMNDSVKIVTAGGATATVDGKADSIQLKAAGSGELNIVAGKVALGASSAELLQQISNQLQKLITFANSVDATHVHVGNLGYETTPPTTAPQFVQLGTDLTTIKGLVDGIKGVL